MSSAIEIMLTSLQQGNYMSLVVLAAVGYDYILTFSREVEYIWCKPWTRVSTLFVFVRYFGLFSYIIPVLMGTSFLPGPALNEFLGEIFAIAYGWSFALFLCPADLVMILRVWVIYDRSRLIICTLLALLAFEIISMVIAAAIYSGPKNLSARTVQVLDTSFCVVQTAPYTWQYVTTILQVTLGTVMCILVIARFMKQSIQIYYATKQWQSNRYVSLIVKEGVLYFLGILLYNIVNTLWVLGMDPSGWQMTMLFIFEFVPIYTLPPRFIISIRELCAPDAQDRDGGVGIDSGFGLSLPNPGTRMSFAAIEADEELEDVEEISMEAGVASQPK